MDKKALFKKFSEDHAHNMPFSLHYNWWNEVVKDDWDVAVVANAEQIFAIMPYYLRNKGPWIMITNPHFTPYCGPFHAYAEDMKTSTRIAFEHLNNDLLIEQLPKFAEFDQNFHLNCTNALQFQWKNFDESNRYTYLLDLKQAENIILSGFRENVKRQIKKASKKLTISETSDIQLVERLCKESVPNNIAPAYFERIANYISKYNCGKIWKATENDKTHAILLSLWDQQSAYYLIGGTAQEFRTSGAISLLMKEAILNAKQLGLPTFNFEGSSVASIEQYLRGFGGELVAYRSITKHNSNALKLAKQLVK